LHKYDSPSFRFEAYLTEIATHFGLHASFNSTPTTLSIVLWSDRHEDEYNHSARMQPGELDMNSLSRTDELAYKLLSGDISLAQASSRLDEIDVMPSPYGKSLTGVSFGLSTSAFAMLMGAGWAEIIYSGLLGLMVYFWTLWALRSRRVGVMLEPVASFSVGFMACVINHYSSSGLNIWLIILSSLIILVPGLSLTMGLAELSSRNLVSGTARVMDATMQLFKLYFGAFLGPAGSGSLKRIICHQVYHGLFAGESNVIKSTLSISSLLAQPLLFPHLKFQYKKVYFRGKWPAVAARNAI
jgi:uncharacterized membrane protein YjjP (DUF1212 family)